MVATTSRVNLSIAKRIPNLTWAYFSNTWGPRCMCMCYSNPPMLVCFDRLIPQKWPLLKWNDQTTVTKMYDNFNFPFFPWSRYIKTLHMPVLPTFFHLTLPHRTAAFVQKLVASNLKRSRERRVCCDAHVYPKRFIRQSAAVKAGSQELLCQVVSDQQMGWCKWEMTHESASHTWRIIPGLVTSLDHPHL